MRNLCEYELKTNRLCKNYKFNDTYCYIHNCINELFLVFYVLFDLFLYLFLPIVVIFTIFSFIDNYINNYLETTKIHNNMYEILM